MRLQNKVALVTAAGQGIGRAVAAAFAREGATVVATDINDSSLAALQAEGHRNLTTRNLDVTNVAAVEALARQQSYNVIFNCAGVVHSGNLLECSDEEFEAAWRLNVASMVHVCKCLLPGMIERGGGSIINMSSVASSIKAVPSRFAYSTTKAAIIGLTKSIAMDFVGARVRCNAICPGTVDTPSLRQRVAAQAAASKSTEDAVRAQFVSRQPMGRLGQAEEIAALAVYLASDESAFTTGAVHVIDGGWTN